jgi:hypothetical protein
MKNELLVIEKVTHYKYVTLHNLRSFQWAPLQTNTSCLRTKILFGQESLEGYADLWKNSPNRTYTRHIIA